MSHRVTVNFDYTGQAIQHQAICDRASESLHKIDDLIAHIKQNATHFTGGEVSSYISELEQSKQNIISKLDTFSDYLDKLKSYGVRQISNSEAYYFRSQLDATANNIKNTIIELTTTRLDVLRLMVNNKLFENMERYQKELREINQNKNTVLSQDKISNLSLITDMSLREATYKELVEDAKLSFDDALQIAKKKLSEAVSNLLEKNRTTILRNLKEELVKNRLDTTEIDEIVNNNEPLSQEKIDEMHALIETKIEDESIRKKAIGMIVGAIKKQGFIFDPKQCIKIDKNKNVVKIAVRRPDGKLCEFEVYINGKFMYHFDGYEGLACTKDESSFVDALEKVYGMKITQKHVDWENPDKHQNKKMQAMRTNVNHNRG